MNSKTPDPSAPFEPAPTREEPGASREGTKRPPRPAPLEDEMDRVLAATVPEWPGLLPRDAAAPDALAPVLLRLLTDLFRARPRVATADAARYAALAAPLVARADAVAALRTALSLVRHPDAPRAVLDALLARGDAAAAAVLSDDARLPPDARNAALAAPVDLAAAFASRPDLTADEALGLANRDEMPVSLALAANPAAPGPLLAEALAARARGARALAVTLAERADVAPDRKAALLPALDAATRARVLEELERAVRGERKSARARSRAAARIEAGARAALLDAAERLDVARFAADAASALDVSADAVTAWVRDPGGDLLAVALVAAGLEEPEVARVLLVLHEPVARSGERFAQLLALVRALSPEAAARAVAAFAEPAAPRGARPSRHAALHDPAERPSLAARIPATEPARPESDGAAAAERRRR